MGPETRAASDSVCLIGVGSNPAKGTISFDFSFLLQANLHPATTWPGHTSPVYQMIFNPNWGTLLTQGNDGDLVIWKETGEVISRCGGNLKSH